MRLIDADEVLSKIDKYHRSEPTEPYSLNDYDKGVNWGLDIATDIVFSTPTVEKRGRWIPHDCSGSPSIDKDVCSACGNRFTYIAETGCTWNYCPNCGAKMQNE